LFNSGALKERFGIGVEPSGPRVRKEGEDHGARHGCSRLWPRSSGHRKGSGHIHAGSRLKKKSHDSLELKEVDSSIQNLAVKY